MRKNKRVFRWTCLGVLCAGLLLVGVGAGMGLAEAATFTYAGDRVLPETAETRTETIELTMEVDGPVELTSYAGDILSGLREFGRIETSGDVTVGTAVLDLTYKTIGPEIGMWYDDWEDGRRSVNLQWYSRNEIGIILACKDQVLADIRDRKLGNYTPAQLTGAVITVNPADGSRVTIG